MHYSSILLLELLVPQLCTGLFAMGSSILCINVSVTHPLVPNLSALLCLWILKWLSMLGILRTTIREPIFRRSKSAEIPVPYIKPFKSPL
jgi:hypothetical protein